ncbi:MAG: hypothetical protein RLZZ241_2617 [Bacteroidota bacterium]|jgi:hypothetical protein
MKKLLFLLAVTHFGIGMIRAATSQAFEFNRGIIFTEANITFSIYPDGEFDFYMNHGVTAGAGLNLGSVGISFNAGFDYGPYVQYDEFGAVIQIENIPIFYDYYGRVNRIGNIGLWYRNNRLFRIGGMNLYYTPSGAFSYHTGFINVFNRNYIFNPMHRYFMRPAPSFCLVNRNPYRRSYSPKRYRFISPFKNNFRRSYAIIGRPHKHVIRENRDGLYLNNSRGNLGNEAVLGRVNPNFRNQTARERVGQRGPVSSWSRNGTTANRSMRSTISISRRIPAHDRAASATNHRIALNANGMQTFKNQDRTVHSSRISGGKMQKSRPEVRNRNSGQMNRNKSNTKATAQYRESTRSGNATGNRRSYNQ